MRADISNIKSVQLKMNTGRLNVKKAQMNLKGIIVPCDFGENALYQKLVNMTDEIIAFLNGIDSGLNEAINNIREAETANMRIGRKLIIR